MMVRDVGKGFRMGLSKSKYCQGVQCAKMLWLARRKPEEADDSCMNQDVLETGNLVGDLAMGYYGPFVEVPYADDKRLMLDETQRLLDAGERVIAEASFAFEGNFCSVDILLVEEDGVRIVEVKSSTHCKSVYLHDMAYQRYVVSACGLNVKSVSLMHLDKTYVRRGGLDLHGLFAVEDRTEEVLGMQEGIPAAIERMRATMEQDEEPGQDIGVHCDKPYPCAFKAYCWRDVPKPSVFDLARAPMTKKVALYESGVMTFADVLDAGVGLSPFQERQAMADALGIPRFFDADAVGAFLDTLSYPLYHLDFETCQQAVPLWDGVSPFQQIPFQYSLHIERAPGELEHREFLAREGEDPRRALAERLCADVPADACVLVYNKTFEKGRLRELAELFPDLADHLVAIRENVRDLMVPFATGACYDRAMGGSCSIKAVLPALCPDDPELDYHALEGVHNGGEAMQIYATLHERAPEEIARVRAQLLAYCRLDTLAMARVLEALRKGWREARA